MFSSHISIFNRKFYLLFCIDRMNLESGNNHEFWHALRGQARYINKAIQKKKSQQKKSQKNTWSVIYFAIEHIIHDVHAVFDNFVWKPDRMNMFYGHLTRSNDGMSLRRRVCVRVCNAPWFSSNSINGILFNANIEHSISFIMH